MFLAAWAKYCKQSSRVWGWGISLSRGLVRNWWWLVWGSLWGWLVVASLGRGLVGRITCVDNTQSIQFPAQNHKLTCDNDWAENGTPPLDNWNWAGCLVTPNCPHTCGWRWLCPCGVSDWWRLCTHRITGRRGNCNRGWGLHYNHLSWNWWGDVMDINMAETMMVMSKVMVMSMVVVVVADVMCHIGSVCSMLCLVMLVVSTRLRGSHTLLNTCSAVSLIWLTSRAIALPIFPCSAAWTALLCRRCSWRSNLASCWRCKELNG